MKLAKKAFRAHQTNGRQSVTKRPTKGIGTHKDPYGGFGPYIDAPPRGRMIPGTGKPPGAKKG